MSAQMPLLIPATKRERVFWQRGVWETACDDAVSTLLLLLDKFLWLPKFSLKRQVTFWSASPKEIKSVYL